MKHNDQELLEQAYTKILNEANTIGDAMAGFGKGVSEAGISRTAVLAGCGRYDEAEQTLSFYVKDPTKKAKIMDWVKTNIKPIKGATTDNLSSNPKFKDWLEKYWVPFINANR
jgi:hypothetical protein